MTATKARGRHTQATSRTRVKCRNPKANNDNKRAKSVLKATPATPLAALAPDGPGDGGTLKDTDPNDEPETKPARPNPDPGAEAENTGNDAKLGKPPLVKEAAGEP
jgi:hypothetical protein